MLTVAPPKAKVVPETTRVFVEKRVFVEAFRTAWIPRSGSQQFCGFIGPLAGIFVRETPGEDGNERDVPFTVMAGRPETERERLGSSPDSPGATLIRFGR